MGGGSSEEQYALPDQPPWIGTDSVIRYYGDRPTQYQRNQLSGRELASAVYAQQHGQQQDELSQLADALDRIGVAPQGQAGF